MKRFARLVQKFCKTGSPRSIARNVTRLWDWADSQEVPEQYWTLLMAACPSAFHDSANPNSCKFTR